MPDTTQHEPVTYDPKTRSFHCPHCMETEEVRAKDAGDPEKLLELKEMIALDHGEYHKYRSVHEAQMARKFRKEAKRRELVQSAGNFRA